MVVYRWFTAKQCDEYSQEHPDKEISRTLVEAKSAAKNYLPDDRVCLLALDGDHIVSRLFFTYGHITHDGQRLRVVAAQNLYTDSAYRGQGIGTQMIVKNAEIGLPCLYAGMSGMSRPIFEKMRYKFIDRSPIYQLPLGLPAIIKELRGKIYDRTDNSSKANVLVDLFAILKSRITVLKRGGLWQVLSAIDAKQALAGILEHPYRPFQVPWNPDLLLASIDGTNPKFHTMVVKSKHDEGSESTHLVTVYLKPGQVRLPLSGRNVTFANGQVNEIFPPPKTTEDALNILGTIAREAKTLELDNLSISAQASAIKAACEELALSKHDKKTVAIDPIGLPTDLADKVTNPANWWCRVLNENQVAEAG